MPIRYKGPTIYIPAKDDYQIDQYTKLLVRCDSNSRYIQDECGHVITQYGNAQVGNMTKIGNKSLMFDGVDDYLTVAASSDFAFGTGNFTVEFFAGTKIVTTSLMYNLSIGPTSSSNIDFDFNGSSSCGLWVYWNGTGTPYIQVGTQGAYTDKKIRHFALVRNSTLLSLYIDGISVGTYTLAVDTIMGSNNNIQIGASGTYYWNGIIQEVRISNIARYTTNFTPPIQRFTTDSNTKLLLHLDDGTIYDDSGTNKSITINGSPVWNIENPNTTKGTIYLPNTNSYCTISDSADWNLSTNDFTIDWWEYRTSNTTDKLIFSRNYSINPGYCDILVGYANSTTTLACYANTQGTASWDILNTLSLGSLVINQWNHFALVRNGSTFKTYKNGIYVATATSTLAIGNTASNPGIGIYGNLTSSTFIGYIDCLRLTNGKALWLNNFTPPKRRIGY